MIAALAAAAVAAAVAWQPALPGYRFQFPADYGAHESSRDEWWYYTGNLRDAHGRKYGFELTFFRVGIQPPLTGGSPWDIDDLYFAHLALTDTVSGGYYHVDQTGRAALGAAGATSGDEHVWIDRWSARRFADSRHVLQAQAGSLGLHLTLTDCTGSAARAHAVDALRTTIRSPISRPAESSRFPRAV
jgi:predicted secreted hydrolase